MISREITLLIHIYGVVQGVGFRPFVEKLANENSISGEVKNDGGIVIIYATADKKAMDIFIHSLKAYAPQGAVIDEITAEEQPYAPYSGFRIIESTYTSAKTPVIPADLPTCGNCLNELYDKNNRRYMHPFISCVACGPRYSIIKSLPYDRCRITMDSFEMCGECESEYKLSERRTFAQTISCKQCGPQLILNVNGSELTKQAALDKAVELINNGGLLAVKAIGGFNFICSAYSQKAVAKLRLLKKRDKKPFAVMFESIDELKNSAIVSEPEEELLLSSARPIVLLKSEHNKLCGEVCAESGRVGAFLPYTPLHYILTDKCGTIVCTSANISGEPIIKDDDKILEFKSEYLDGVLYNKREIITPLDDSVACVVAGKAQLIRRSRGYVPAPILLNTQAGEPVFAAGGDLKAGFCLLTQNSAYLSQYFGDLENANAMKVYESAYKHMTQLFNISPKTAVCDLHPLYNSTRFAEKLGLKLIKVQHHHAHIASVMAEHKLNGKVIGVAFDGTGYGDDGAVWGGEFLVCDESSHTRAAHLSYTAMCGGDNAAKNAMLCAACYLHAAGQDRLESYADYSTVKAAIDNKINIHQTSSMGRLFDAVSAILNIKEFNSFEGECAIALQNYAEQAVKQGIKPIKLSFKINEYDDIIKIDVNSIINQIYKIEKDNLDKRAAALGFHYAVGDMAAEVCSMINAKTGIGQVALSGGVFANTLLTEYTISSLRQYGLQVYINSKVPTNDGGISLGQAFIAANIINKQ